ncbi:D-alanine--D-alanine ligase [Mesorhizobium sp. M0586]|uniref:D-alanine--D-alanine ligase n=1 Tax=unclassified Mesorhizobium TaxID=325217 RepID=UPI00333A6E2D
MLPEVSFIFGGISTECDSSISSLEHIISSYLTTPDAERPFSVKHLYHLSPEDCLVRTIQVPSALTSSDMRAYISDTGARRGRTLICALDEIQSRKEYVVNLLHGQFGEDGGVQTLAALLGLRGTFGDPYVASLTMNKYAMSSFVSSLLPNEVVKVPRTRLIKSQNMIDEMQIAKSLQGPIVVKPNSLGSSLFTDLFQDTALSEPEIVALLHAIFEYDSSALLQEFIPGSEYSCGCMIDSLGVTVLPVIKIETERRFFGRNEKCSGDLVRLKIVDCGDAISGRIKSIVSRIATSIDLYNFARFDFIVDDSAGIWFLECNYIPGLGRGNIFPTMLESHGMTVIELISFLLSKSSQFKRKDHRIRY